MRKPPVEHAINFWADDPPSLENAYQILPPGKKETSQLAAPLGIPPLDVFKVTTGSWAARRDKWILEVGIRGEEGRASDVAESDDVQVASYTNEAYLQGSNNGLKDDTAGTSVFDPVLCEVGYGWFCPKGGSILDPFAGGTTRGLVAAYLGYEYTGIEIRQGQVDANRKQLTVVKARHDMVFAREIAAGIRQPMKTPNWIVGDSTNLEKLLPTGETYDLLFSCPPYFDLEKYSTKKGDGSRAETYEEFMVWLENIYRQAVARLRNDRFAVTTVGDMRNKKTGAYRLFPEDTTIMFARRLGLVPHNKAILCTPIGRQPIRTAASFPSNRRLGHVHQEVKIFWKGEERLDAVKEAMGELALINAVPLVPEPEQ